MSILIMAQMHMCPFAKFAKLRLKCHQEIFTQPSERQTPWCLWRNDRQRKPIEAEV